MSRAAATLLAFCLGLPALADEALTEQCNRSVGFALSQQPILFAPGTAQLSGLSFSTLATVAEFAAECADADIIIEGHTDSRGSEALNLRLSQARATRVASYLVALGIRSERLTSEGFGSSRPIGDNATRRGRETNRRVVVRFVNRD